MSTDGETRPVARLTVLAGPSGTGRESVVELVRARSPFVWTPVPATTRPRRDGELAGIDRVFLDPADFDQLAGSGELLEWSRIGPYRRGTPVGPVRARLRAGQPVLLPLDLPGAVRVRAAMPEEARLVLLRPPGYRPDPAVAAVLDHTVRYDRTEQVIDELVGLLGSSVSAPVRPLPSGQPRPPD
ncbi:guanylate kinase [Micromonospora rosaria]|uniref:Guanylate kinase n=1 Tax=Micromonospora rosaria TaxID=47874 RepID=A0A136PIN2_9ACTN|nr:guanylate kinase [Micromonospora rosaria]KXK58262.1 guanylate kinase [Micromonospora rosaria]